VSDKSVYESLRGLHESCAVCGSDHPFGLKLGFAILEPGRVRASVVPVPEWNGYSHRLHGGVAASILDGAMTHALFSLGIAAVTAALEVRYHRPVRVGVEIQAVGHRVRSRRSLHILEATIHQGGILCVSAVGRFMESEEVALPERLRGQSPASLTA
jgi:uncharacterized protein (TIGR00369 family)